MQKFSHLFQGLGKLEGNYTIELKNGTEPYVLTTPRRVPIPLMEAVRKELQRMEELGVITPVTEPTEWRSGMVVVPKAGGKVRICVDLTKLNRCVCRERHMYPTSRPVEQILAQLAGAKVFSKLDANSGFWQIPLANESSLLTTFITPFGRYVLQRLAESGLTLNREKYQFNKDQVMFLGQVVNKEGIQADPDKVTAIQEVSLPRNVGDIRRFLGMVNQMGKFIPDASTELQRAEASGIHIQIHVSTALCSDRKRSVGLHLGM